MTTKLKVKSNNRALVDCIREARAFLGENNYQEMLKEYKFIEYLSRLENFPIQSPIFNWLIPRAEVEDNDNPNKRILKFNISGHSYTFGLVEFALITGLPFGDYLVLNTDEETPFRTFLETDRLKFSQLCAKLHLEKHRDPSSIEMRKLVVLFILHKMVFVRADRNIIHLKAVTLADHPVLFNSYPWGRMVYEEVIREWAGILIKLHSPKGNTMQLTAFPFVIQPWALESLLPQYAASLATRLPGNELPRIFRWHTTEVFSHGNYSLPNQLIFHNQKVSFMRMIPEPVELEQDYYRNVRSYIDYRPAHEAYVMPGQSVDDENIPGFLAMNLQVAKLVKKVRRLKENVSCLERERLDVKKVEVIVAKRVGRMFEYKFDMALYQMEKKLRDELNMRPPEHEPPKVVEVNAEGKFVDVADDEGFFVELNIDRKLEEDDKLDVVKPEVSECLFDGPLISQETIVACRPARKRKPGPAVVSPYMKVEHTKKNKKLIEKCPTPYDPINDWAFDTSKYDVLRSWVTKNLVRAEVVELVSVVKFISSISCKNLAVLTSATGWLRTEEIDAHMQLLNLQAEEYPQMFKSTRWTCLGSLYSRNVKYAYELFQSNRSMYADQGMAKAPVSWADIAIGTYQIVAGMNENWPSKAWGGCQQVYGIENIAGAHWAAYAYDFNDKEVRIYDSMSNAYIKEREEVFRLRAELAPSLFNEGVEIKEDKLDVNTPFVVKIVNVPQQPNGYDCGVYAIKFVQCLTMKADLHGLEAAHFGDYRRKLAIDLVKWSKTSGGNFIVEEKEIPIV